MIYFINCFSFKREDEQLGGKVYMSYDDPEKSHFLFEQSELPKTNIEWQGEFFISWK